MSKCPTCGAPAKFEICLPDGNRVPAASLIDANRLLREHQRQWPNEDLAIVVAAQTAPEEDTFHE